VFGAVGAAPAGDVNGDGLADVMTGVGWTNIARVLLGSRTRRSTASSRSTPRAGC
jgi:hypothetical protein